jgi:hypothetical protein
VIWRGRHVAEPSELAGEEAAARPGHDPPAVDEWLFRDDVTALRALLAG